MPRRAPSLLAALALVTAGCTAEQPASREPEPTYPLSPREVRPDERPLDVTGKDGDTEFVVIGMTSGMEALVGSHAESPAKESYLRLRLVVTNTGRSTVLFDAMRQRLVLAAGSAAKPDSQAMLIRRQPEEFDLGSGVRVEFDLYYDVPADTKPRALRAFGGATLTDAHDRESTDIPLDGG